MSFSLASIKHFKKPHFSIHVNTSPSEISLRKEKASESRWYKIHIPEHFRFNHVPVLGLTGRQGAGMNLQDVLEIWEANEVPVSMMMRHDDNFKKFCLSWYMHSRRNGGQLVPDMEREVSFMLKEGFLFDQRLTDGIVSQMVKETMQ